jgi:hypothetical protein
MKIWILSRMYNPEHQKWQEWTKPTYGDSNPSWILVKATTEKDARNFAAAKIVEEFKFGWLDPGLTYCIDCDNLPFGVIKYV